MNPADLPDWLKPIFQQPTPEASDALRRGTHIHSDLDGVSRISFSENVEEKFLDIQKELKAAKIIA